MPTKGIKNLASRKAELSFPGKTLRMTGSPQRVPAPRLENIVTVQAESRLWSLDFIFFFKNYGVEHSFDALMESRELNNMFHVWIKER